MREERTWAHVDWTRPDRLDPVPDHAMKRDLTLRPGPEPDRHDVVLVDGRELDGACGRVGGRARGEERAGPGGDQAQGPVF